MKKDKSQWVIAHWEAEDGYRGGARPHQTEIPLEDYLECETDEERERLVDDYVREDFEQRVSYGIRRVEVPGAD